MDIQDVKQFLSEYNECVVATVGDNMQPEAATVGFSVDEDFNFVIATNASTRKSTNLQSNNKIAIVVGFSGPKTVQLEGEASIISSEADKARIDLHLAKVPSAAKYANEPGQTYYKITPKWLRYTDYTKDPDIYETENFE